MQSDTGQRQLKLVKPKHLNLHPTNQTSTDNNQSQNQSPSQAFKNLNKTVQNQNTTKIITAKNVVGYPHSNFIRNNDSLNNKKYDQQSINATKNPEKLNLPSQNNSPRKNVVPTQKTSSLPIDTISNSTTIRNKSLTTSSTLHASFNENIQQPSTSSTTQEIKNKKVKRKLLVTKDQQMREKRKRESLNEVRQQNIEDKLGKIARNLHTNVNYDKSAEEKRSRVDDFAEGDDDEEEDDEENVVDGDGGDEDLRNDRNDVSDDDSGLKSDKTGKVIERVAKESSKGKCEKEKVKEPEKLKETSKNKAEKDKFKTSSLAKIDKMVKPEKNVKPDKVMKQIKQEKIGKQDKLMKPEKLIKQEKSDKLVKQEKLVKQAGSKQDVSRKSSNATSKVVKKSKNAKIAENGNSKSSGGDGEDDSGMNDEAKYCSCQNISYGNMIACDNDDCELEWFHFGCVGLSNKPKGKWYCPTCKDKVKT